MISVGDLVEVLFHSAVWIVCGHVEWDRSYTKPLSFLLEYLPKLPASLGTDSLRALVVGKDWSLQLHLWGLHPMTVSESVHLWHQACFHMRWMSARYGIPCPWQIWVEQICLLHWLAEFLVSSYIPCIYPSAIFLRALYSQRGRWMVHTHVGHSWSIVCQVSHLLPTRMPSKYSEYFKPLFPFLSMLCLVSFWVCVNLSQKCSLFLISTAYLSFSSLAYQVMYLILTLSGYL